MMTFKLSDFYKKCQVRKDPSKGPFAKDWAQWEEKLQLVLFENADYLNSIQVTIVYLLIIHHTFCFCHMLI